MSVAYNGSEALEMYITHDPPIKLVLLDVTLPDMTGHEVSMCEGGRGAERRGV